VSYLAAERHDDAKFPSGAVIDALADDLNTPAALAVLREEAKEARDNRHRAAKFLTTLEFLGLVRRDRLGVFETGLAGIGIEVSPEAAAQAEKLRAAYANGDAAGVAAGEAALAALLPDAELELRESGALILTAHDSDLEGRVESLIEARQAARAARDFAESDRIRDELKALGIQLKDNKDGTTSWEIAR
jgi:cysteinyl-tRNA synthetase